MLLYYWDKQRERERGGGNIEDIKLQKKRKTKERKEINTLLFIPTTKFEFFI